MICPQYQFLTRDGVAIRYQDTGGAGPVLVLANGLGGTHSAWRHFIRYFEPSCRVVSWDYRGLYGSSAAPLDRLGVAFHASDCLELLDHLGVSGAILAGWSMGVNVIFEVASRWPERVIGLLPICGSAGRIFESALPVPALRPLLPTVCRTLARLERPLGVAMGAVTRFSATASLLRGLGIVAPTCDMDVFHDLAREFSGLDFATYFTIMERLGEHDAWPTLVDVAVPTLVIGGDRDALTPPDVSVRMAELIPGAELFIIRTGTHYAPVEFPELINLRVEKFLRERFPLPVTAARA